MDSIRASEAPDPGSIPGEATTKSRPEKERSKLLRKLLLQDGENDLFIFENIYRQPLPSL
jgi:hypothetical protein